MFILLHKYANTFFVSLYCNQNLNFHMCFFRWMPTYFKNKIYFAKFNLLKNPTIK